MLRLQTAKLRRKHLLQSFRRRLFQRLSLCQIFTFRQEKEDLVNRGRNYTLEHSRSENTNVYKKGKLIPNPIIETAMKVIMAPTHESSIAVPATAPLAVASNSAMPSCQLQLTRIYNDVRDRNRVARAHESDRLAKLQEWRDTQLSALPVGVPSFSCCPRPSSQARNSM